MKFSRVTLSTVFLAVVFGALGLIALASGGAAGNHGGSTSWGNGGGTGAYGNAGGTLAWANGYPTPTPLPTTTATPTPGPGASVAYVQAFVAADPTASPAASITVTLGTSGTGGIAPTTADDLLAVIQSWGNADNSHFSCPTGWVVVTGGSIDTLAVGGWGSIDTCRLASGSAKPSNVTFSSTGSVSVEAIATVVEVANAQLWEAIASGGVAAQYSSGYASTTGTGTATYSQSLPIVAANVDDCCLTNTVPSGYTQLSNGEFRGDGANSYGGEGAVAYGARLGSTAIASTSYAWADTGTSETAGLKILAEQNASGAPSPSPTPTTAPTGTFDGIANASEAVPTPYASAPASIWNTPVSSSPTFLSNSASIIGAQFPGGAGGGIRANEAGQYDYTHPLFFASNTDPSINLACNQYCPVGGPTTMRIPAVARPAGGSDAHIAVVQPDGTEIDAWATYGVPDNSGAPDMQGRNWQTNDTLTAGNVSTCGNFITGNGLTLATPGPTAANFCLRGGITTAAELASGTIHHALFLVGQCAVGSQYPSSGSTQQCTSGLGPPLGAREWYDVPCATTEAQPTRSSGSNPTGALWPWEKALLCAFNVYGGYLGDNLGGGANFTGTGIIASSFESEEPWRDFNGTGTNKATYTSPFSVLSAQGWTSFPIGDAIGSSSGNRWYYPGNGDSNSDWAPPDASGNPVNWATHLHWLNACSAYNAC